MQYLATFKGYLHSVEEEYVLHAYNEATELSEELSELNTVVLDAEVRLSIFLHDVNAFYDKYVALGASLRIGISEGTHGDLMRRFANSTNIEHEVNNECAMYKK